MNLNHIISRGISTIDRNSTNSITGMLTDFLQTQGINMNELWSPELDITETSSEIIVYINIPGVKPNSIDIDFFNNRININGERSCPFTNNTNIHHNEIAYGRFERKVALPISVTSRDSVNINFDNGVLIIKIDKAQEESNRFSMRIPENFDSNNSGDTNMSFSCSSTEDEDEDEDVV